MIIQNSRLNIGFLYRSSNGEKIAKLLDDPSTVKFSKDIIQAAIKLDPCKAAKYLETLAILFGDRADRIVQEEEDNLLDWSIANWQDNGGEG